MVSDEARARAEALKSKEELQGQLEEARSLLTSESKSKERLRLKLIELAAKSSKPTNRYSNDSKQNGRETFYMKRRSVQPGGSKLYPSSPSGSLANSLSGSSSPASPSRTLR
eukprot:TRINITY_DN8099_c0_g1_i1.p2 TRINITY_DN8099_c0_g1~~TRINITY_DN8099_c0_g1_i1.p2  ORF type:complete len:112 (-),score=33.84 TRINITY_DN8099_c0_g1_i1:37-372(-)